MSNVLVGIIGVILFIGLALAGALILGSDFTTATSASKAAAISQQLTQIAAAINMYQLKTGRTMIASDDNVTLLQPRFLKSYPAANPVNGNTYRINDAIGNTYATPVKMVITPLGTDQRARDVCTAIEETTTPNPDLTPKSDFGVTVASKAAVGCLRYSLNNEYYAFISV